MRSLLGCPLRSFSRRVDADSPGGTTPTPTTPVVTASSRSLHICARLPVAYSPDKTFSQAVIFAKSRVLQYPLSVFGSYVATVVVHQDVLFVARFDDPVLGDATSHAYNDIAGWLKEN